MEYLINKMSIITPSCNEKLLTNHLLREAVRLSQSCGPVALTNMGVHENKTRQFRRKKNYKCKG